MPSRVLKKAFSSRISRRKDQLFQAPCYPITDSQDVIQHPASVFALVFFTLFLAAACKHEAPATRVMIVVDAEPGARSRIDDVDLAVKTGSGEVSHWSARYSASLTPGSGAIRWPLQFALEPRRPAEIDRGYLVLVTARDAQGKALAELHAISGYVEGKTVELPLWFDDECLSREAECS